MYIILQKCISLVHVKRFAVLSYVQRTLTFQKMKQHKLYGSGQSTKPNTKQILNNNNNIIPNYCIFIYTQRERKNFILEYKCFT